MSAKSRVPKLRFRGFSGEWEEKKLIDEVELFRGLTYSPHDVIKNNGTLVLRSSNVKNGKIVNADNVYVNSEVVNCDYVRIGDIVIVVRNGSRSLIGKHGQVKIKMKNTVIGAFMTGFRSKKPAFINALLDTTNFHQEIEKNLGATINQITNGAFKQMYFSFAKPNEQTKIGNYFQNLDKLIEQKEKKYKKLGQLKKAMLEKMFPKDGANTPELRFKGFSGEWEEKNLEKLANFSKGQGYSKGDLVNFGTPIILYGRLYTKYQTVISKVDTCVVKSATSIFSKGNEVIIPSSGETAEDIARASAITVKDIILGGDLNIIYPSDKINNIFLALNISNGKTQKDLLKKAQGKSVVHLRNNDLKEIVLSYPRISEQTKIGNYFQKLDNLIDLQNQELQKLKNIKKASLAKMFV